MRNGPPDLAVVPWEAVAAAAMKPLGDGFIMLIKMIIAPVVFCTVVHGISSVQDAGRVGRVGVKALVYFEVVSTFALAIGLLVAKVLQTGSGFNIDPTKLDAQSISGYTQRVQSDSAVAHFMAIIPDTFVGAFAQGELLQVLVVLTGFAINALPEKGRLAASQAVNTLSEIFLGVIKIVVKAAPLGRWPSPSAPSVSVSC